MLAPKIILSTFLLAHGSHVVSAQSSNSSRRSPWNYRDHEYDVRETFSQPPNATGEWSIPGVDLTKPWAGNDSFSDDAWNIYTAVFAVLNKTTGTWANPSNHWLRIPEDSFEGDEIDEGWAVCGINFHGSNFFKSRLEAMQDDDEGNCDGGIPQECIDALLARADAVDCDDWSQSDAPSLDSCDGLTTFGVEDFTFFGIAETDILTEKLSERVAADNGTAISLVAKSYPYAPADNETAQELAYDEAVSAVVPHIISYKYRNGDTSESRSVLKCARGAKVADGSRKPESVGNVADGAYSLPVPIFSAIAVAAAMVCLV